MPLTKKGKKIRRKMKQTYGSKNAGDAVFYASAKAGTIKRVHKKKPKTRRRGKCRKGRK